MECIISSESVIPFSLFLQVSSRNDTYHHQDCLTHHTCRIDTDKNSKMVLQSEERQVGHVNVNLDIDISVVSERKWLKFGVQAHFFKIFGHAKF